MSFRELYSARDVVALLVIFALGAFTFGHMAAGSRYASSGAAAMAAASGVNHNGERERNRYCATPRTVQEDALCQAWRSAEASERASTDTNSNWWMSIFQALVGTLAMLATGYAAFETGRAARAAKGSTDIARQALLELERPVVVLKDMKVIIQPAGFRFLPVWENSGNTIARHVVVNSNFKPSDTELPDDYRYDHDNKSTRVVIGPHSTIGGGALDMGMPHILAVLDQGWHAYLWGWSEYESSFSASPRFRTEYCLEIIPRREGPGIVADLIMHSTHNLMDRDCPRGRFRTILGGEPNPSYTGQNNPS